MSLATHDARGEADALTSVVTRHFDALRAGTLGRRFDLDDIHFQLLGSARNTIYRVAHRSRWFLKLSRSGDATPFAHEDAGARVMAGSLGGNPQYAGAAVIRASTAPPFVLSSEIAGRPLNALFFTRVWVPSPSAPLALASRFHTLGTLLSELHATARVTPDTIVASTTPFRTLRQLLERAGERDRTTGAIASWLDSHERPDGGDTFIHGNFRFDNVLDVGGRLAFIDFENCGRGSCYQDLSRPISELLLTRCAIYFPVERAMQCAREFLREYANRLSYDAGALRDFVAARIARYYLENRQKSLLRRTIGGIPVSLRRVNDITLQAVGGTAPLW